MQALELAALLGDLYTAYTGTDAPGDLPLLERLTRAYHHQVIPRTPGERTHRPPGPRPPGADGPMLARDEIEQALAEWVRFFRDGMPLRVTRPEAAGLLPTLALQKDDGAHLGELLHDVRSVHRVALLVLGVEDPPSTVGNAVCPGCERRAIAFDRHADRGDVWCSTSGYRASACHDDTRWPDCRDPDTGVIRCRRSPRSTRHARRWDHSELHLLIPQAAR